tara:strand:- start:427 stop:1272 length:846 start_codon:yes stop_codon:yes gene_type:complete
MNYRNLILRGTKILKNNSILTADIDAELLLSISLKKSRSNILLNLDQDLSNKQIEKYIDLIHRRKNKEPISFITGKRFFWKNDFKIDKYVLTPRFETELLVEAVLKNLKFYKRISVLDIGTGSGCIIISLLKEKQNWKGTAVDISKFALKNAKTNAKMQQVYNRIKFINSDIDKFCGRKYDLIVSNPPYINKIGYNSLDNSVKDYEPEKALCGGVDGYNIIEKVIKKSKTILKNDGLLAIEIGMGQKFKTSNLLNNNGFYILKIVKDYQNIQRCILAKKSN